MCDHIRDAGRRPPGRSGRREATDASQKVDVTQWIIEFLERNRREGSVRSPGAGARPT